MLDLGVLHDAEIKYLRFELEATQERHLRVGVVVTEQIDGSLADLGITSFGNYDLIFERIHECKVILFGMFSGEESVESVRAYLPEELELSQKELTSRLGYKILGYKIWLNSGTTLIVCCEQLRLQKLE